MTSIDDLWRQLEATGPGGSTRVDDSHPSDLYGSTDAEGHVGLLLVSDVEPPPPPVLEAVQLTVRRRHDGRWALGIWLHESDLRAVFAQLCGDLVEASRDLPAPSVPGYLLSRMSRWRQLLEAGGGPMGMSELRGLVGELLVLEECFEHWTEEEVVTGWVGPLAGPNDFVLPGHHLEVKTTFPSARSVRITSIDQLDRDERLTLGVVILTTLGAPGEGLAAADLVDRLSRRIFDASGPDGLATFERRLDAARWEPDPLYSRPMFRFDRIDYYSVTGEFPRLRRPGMPAGIGRVMYDILIGSCSPYRTRLSR
jgi:Putative  PD-(D/E)XK family member, (DUF4420)